MPLKIPKIVQTSLRQALIDSYVAAVAIAVLLVWALDLGFRALWGPIRQAADFLFNAIAIFGVPYFDLSKWDRMMLLISGLYLLQSILSLAVAWVLSIWIYGRGPIKSLMVCRDAIIGRQHV